MQHRPRDAQLGGSASDAEVGGPFEIFTGDVEGLDLDGALRGYEAGPVLARRDTRSRLGLHVHA